MMIEVLLTKNVESIGKEGEVIRVRPGFARNYLFPHGLAREATPALKAAVESKRAKEEASRAARRKTLEALAQKISKVSVTLSAKVGANKALYGSIGAAEIAAALKGQGIAVEKEAIGLVEPLKQAGVFTVPVRLAPDLESTLKVWIVEEGARG